MGTNRLAVGTVGPDATFYLQADEISSNPAANTSVVRAWLVCVPKYSSTWYAYHDATVLGDINGTQFAVSGASADIAQGGRGWTYGPYDVTVPHDPGGGKVSYIGLSVNYPNASGKGGTTTGWLGLSQLTVPPNTPSNVHLTRISDTQLQVSWQRNEPSNGAATIYGVDLSRNAAQWERAVNVSPTSSVVISCTPNANYWAQVSCANGAGDTPRAQSAEIVFMTPAAPSNVAASKGDDNNITVTWTPNAGYPQHQHLVRHGVVTDTGTTWDQAYVATLPAGTNTWTHTSPDTSKVHIYQVSCQATDTAKLTSPAVDSNSVQLLAPPNAPVITTSKDYTDLAKDLVITWQHNPVDTTAQTAYELQYSTDGGKTWDTTSKVTSTSQSRTFPKGTYAANSTLTVRVRTWGQATTGGFGGSGGSTWSEQDSITFKSAPVVTIQSPGTVVNQSALHVVLGFSQAQGATPVQAQINLRKGSTNIETVRTTTLPGTDFTTRLEDGATYQLTVFAIDSNGLSSAAATLTFTVDYLEPVAATCQVTYLESSGAGQLDVTIPTPEAGQAAAVEMAITRTIDGQTETVLTRQAASSVSILDTTPALNKTNVYTVTTWSAENASATITVELTPAETKWSFCNSGVGYQDAIRYYGNLLLGTDPKRQSAMVATAGRSRPIALFGAGATVAHSVTATLVTGEGSTPEEIERWLLAADRACYRDPTGRRVFGLVQGAISNRTWSKADLTLTIQEAQ